MPIEPVEIADFFLSFFTAAMIVLLAALYAALFAWGKIQGDRRFLYGAALSYAALLACVQAFGKINHFEGVWQILTLLMAFGYAVMPYLVWRLCVSTHSDHSENSR